MYIYVYLSGYMHTHVHINIMWVYKMADFTFQNRGEFIGPLTEFEFSVRVPAGNRWPSLF